MTNFTFRNVMLAAVIWTVSSAAASAQMGQNRIQYPLGRPTVSPYLNLLGSSYGAGINYYGLVRPQQQFYQQAEDLRQGVYSRGGRTNPNSATNRTGQTPPNTMRSAYRLGATGHATSFRVIGNVQQQSGGLSSPLNGLNQLGTASGAAGRNSSGRSRTGFSGHGADFSYGAAYGGQQN